MAIALFYVPLTETRGKYKFKRTIFARKSWGTFDKAECRSTCKMLWVNIKYVSLHFVFHSQWHWWILKVVWLIRI